MSDVQSSTVGTISTSKLGAAKLFAASLTASSLATYGVAPEPVPEWIYKSNATPPSPANRAALTMLESGSGTPQSYSQLEQRVGDMALRTGSQLDYLNSRVSDLSQQVATIAAEFRIARVEALPAEPTHFDFSDDSWADYFNALTDQPLLASSDVQSNAVKALSSAGNASVILAAARLLAACANKTRAQTEINAAMLAAGSRSRLVSALQQTLRDFQIA